MSYNLSPEAGATVRGCGFYLFGTFGLSHVTCPYSVQRIVICYPFYCPTTTEL